MKILVVSDHELRELWDYWDAAGRKRTEGVSLILSAGDVKPEYLEFLVTMLNVPCLYVRGNHDSVYDEKPPMGCINIDGKVAEITVQDRAADAGDKAKDGGDAAGLTQASDAGARTLRIAGLGGSMRYRKGTDMYTEREMRNRMRKLLRRILFGIVTGVDERSYRSSELSDQARAMGINPFTKRRKAETVTATEKENAETQNTDGRPDAYGPVDIFLTHAPCYGHGDLEDIPHTGFKCFNRFHELVRPRCHCYGHVHLEYNGLMKREAEHPAGAKLINVSGMYILEI